MYLIIYLNICISKIYSTFFKIYVGHDFFVESLLRTSRKNDCPKFDPATFVAEQE